MTECNYRNSESDTRAELIEPKLQESLWKSTERAFIRREWPISIGRIISSKERGSTLSADFVLIYKNVKVAVIEAKKSSLNFTEGVTQAKKYAELLKIRFTYATNGHCQQ